jgi:hypothetical protein
LCLIAYLFGNAGELTLDLKKNAYLEGMTAILFFELLGAAMVVLLGLVVFLRQRKKSDLFNRYCEAMQAENNGEEERAIRLYREALSRSQKMAVGDKKLKNSIEERLKTLQISTEFSRSFQQLKAIVKP